MSIYHRVKNINSENFITGFMGGISVEKETFFFLNGSLMRRTFSLTGNEAQLKNRFVNLIKIFA